MALSETDRTLLTECLQHKPGAWEGFVDRFMGVVIHVINHTAQCRSVMLSNADREDLAAEVLMTIVADDYAVLRRFRGESSLATYLTVIARRVAVRGLLAGHQPASLDAAASHNLASESSNQSSVEQRMTDQEEVSRLMGQLNGPEAEVIRMYHLEGKTYQEISRTTGMPANSVGPLLSRARTKMRDAESTSL